MPLRYFFGKSICYFYNHYTMAYRYFYLYLML
nr:MAG TPA: hypothetical protein [Caudoviricetes sp.]